MNNTGFFVWISDVATEKSQQDLIHGIEGFDATKLKHAQTQEKNPLPDKDGTYWIGFHIFMSKSTSIFYHSLTLQQTSSNCNRFVLITLVFFVLIVSSQHSNRSGEGTAEFHKRHRKLWFIEAQAYRDLGKESIANQRDHRRREARCLKSRFFFYPWSISLY